MVIVLVFLLFGLTWILFSSSSGDRKRLESLETKVSALRYAVLDVKDEEEQGDEEFHQMRFSKEGQNTNTTQTCKSFIEKYIPFGSVPHDYCNIILPSKKDIEQEYYWSDVAPVANFSGCFLTMRGYILVFKNHDKAIEIFSPADSNFIETRQISFEEAKRRIISENEIPLLSRQLQDKDVLHPTLLVKVADECLVLFVSSVPRFWSKYVSVADLLTNREVETVVFTPTNPPRTSKSDFEVMTGTGESDVCFDTFATIDSIRPLPYIPVISTPISEESTPTTTEQKVEVEAKAPECPPTPLHDKLMEELKAACEKRERSKNKLGLRIDTSKKVAKDCSLEKRPDTPRPYSVGLRKREVTSQGSRLQGIKESD